MLLSWILFSIYLVATAALAWRGGKRAGDDAGYAIGGGHMNPWLVGLTLGACLASSATFAIMPGWVYAEGAAALIGFTLPFVGGIAVGLVVLAPRFQELGADGALTLPHWLGRRYEDVALQRTFAALNILQLAYLVLITVGCAMVMEQALGVPYPAAVVGIITFVFGYTAFGGSYAHAYTNALQGAVMLVVALLIFGSGWSLWADGTAVAELATSGTTAPGSALFSSTWEVWGISFLMGAALTTQPHLLTKALYVRGRSHLRVVIGVGLAAYAVFSLVLFAGVYARVLLPAGLDRKAVMAQYLAEAFPWEAVGAVASVAILSASMSTLDGLLVAISASVGHDLVGGRHGVWANRAVLVVLAVATLAIALQPPALVLTLGQLGVYGLVAASAGPLLVGMFAKGSLNGRWALASAAVALLVHLGAVLGGLTANPGVGAALGIAAGLPVAALATAASAAAPRRSTGTRTAARPVGP